MTEELDDEKRTWYLKGYAQAEADQEALIKKLMKDISDLSEARNGLLEDLQIVFKPELDVAEYNRLVIENDELKMRLFDAVRMIKNPNISNFGLRLKRIEDCLHAENHIEVKSAKAEIKKKAVLECVTIAWDAPEPDGWDVAIRIAKGMGYEIVQDGGLS